MLVDVDLLTEDRATPSPNLHDVTPVDIMSAKGTNAVNYVTPATNLALVSAAKNGQFTIVQSGTLITQAFTDTAGVGVYVSGKFTHAQIPHNLPYIPTFLGYYVDNVTSTYTPLPRNYTAVGNSSGTNNPGQNGGWFRWALSADATYLYLTTTYLLYNYTVTTVAGQQFRYYLLQQPLN